MTLPTPNHSMRWLIWKDYRANRPVVWAGLFLLLLPYALATAAIAWRWSGAEQAALMFVAAGIYSIILTQLIFAVFGGNAIAGERADRSAEFLAALPISRRRKLASKLWLGLGLWLTAWIPNLLVVVGIVCLLGQRTLPLTGGDYWGMPVATAITGLTFFGVAWMLSAMLESPTFAAGAGIVAPIVVGTCVVWGDGLLEKLGVYSRISTLLGIGDLRGGAPVNVAYLGTCLLIAIACFTIGTRYYLRRVEP